MNKILLWENTGVFKPGVIYASDYVESNGRDLVFRCPFCSQSRSYLRSGGDADKFEQLGINHMKNHKTIDNYLKFYAVSGLKKIISKLKNNKI